MKIRTQFILTMVLFGAVIGAVAASAIITEVRVAADHVRQATAASIALGASDLSYLSNDYVIYGESQQLARWQARYEDFSAEVANLHSNVPEQAALVNSIQSSTRRLKEVFDGIAASVQRGPDPISLASLQVSWSRMAVQTQGLSSDATLLAQLARAQEDAIRQANMYFVFGLVGLFATYFIATFTLIQRRILRSVAALQAGVAVVATGKLDYAISERRNDEVGDLSRAFNQMTRQLKAVTASKAELEKEVEQRTRAEQALRESETRFRNLFASMNEGVCEHEIIYDAARRPVDYVITGINPAYETITGLKAEVAVGARASQLYGTDEPPYLDVYARVAQTGEPYYFETYHAPMAKHFSISVFSPGRGRFVTVFSDITERKKSDAEIAHLASFPQLNPNPILELDTSGNIGYANPAALERFPDLLELGAGHPFLTAFSAAFASAEHRPVAVDVAVGDDWFEQTLTYVPDTQSYRLYARDITARKRAEEELRESEASLKRAQEIAHLGSWELDLVANRLTWSDEVYRIFGLRPQEFGATYEAFLERVHPDDRQKVDDAYRGSVRENRDTYEVEHRVVRQRTGEVRVVHERCEHFRDATGKIIRSVGMVHDITERKRAEDELRRANAELDASNRELEAFSYSVSHDLRAPLRSMEGFSSALIEDYRDKLDEQGRRYLKHVQDASDLMARLIDDLLKLSRVTRGEMNREVVDLSDLARTTVAALEKAEPDRRVEVSIAPDITANGDRSLLRLALENLLGNAWKFTGKVASPRIEMGVTEHDGRQAYFVRDNGAGFDMAYADKLFQPFQRLHKASEYPGTGIGLATVQRIIRRHGGQVWVESEVGHGATFYFTLG